MLAPYSWIKAYADTDLSAEEFAHRMVMTGTEVEEVRDLSQGLDRVVVGRIEKLAPHPDSDHLQVCTTDVGEEEPVVIITGADNVFEGALVPAALIGANLPNGLQIKKGRLRGLDSYGMLCSGEELGITDDHYPGAGVNGILILREEYTPGTPIADVLGMNEKVLDFKILANRPDCMSILGLAREARAVLDTQGGEPVLSYQAGGLATSDVLSVEVRDTVRCLRYMACVVRDVKIGPSPKWMRDRLLAAGQRPINNIVDITNYVMLEMGQPLHAFDLRHVKGNKIVVRTAGEGEILRTLDEKDRALSESMLVICNEEEPMAVAGIMGGVLSGIMDDTADVVFEAATFDTTSTRRTSRALGLRTESSSRFEKGVDITLAETGLRRALALVSQLACGTPASSWIDAGRADYKPRVLTMRREEVTRLLGLDIPAREMAEILTRLHFGAEVTGDTLSLTVPSYRGDVTGPADIAEEVLRLYGYDRVPAVLISGEMHRGRRTAVQQARYALKDFAAGLGFHETMSYSFMSPTVLDKLLLARESPLRRAVRVRNPLGEEYSLMRTSLLPALLGNILTNQNRRAGDIRLFEMARVFVPKELPVTDLPVETLMLSLGISSPEADFFAMKGVLEALFEAFRLDNVEFSAGGESYLHPGRKALAKIGSQVLAEVGELHPDVMENFGLSGRCVYAQVNADLLIASMKSDNAIRPLPRYPSVKLDLAVTVDETIPAGELLREIQKRGGELLEACSVFDVYRGGQVGEGKKSVAFSLEFRAEDHTLTDREVEQVYDRILRNLGHSFGAVRR